MSSPGHDRLTVAPGGAPCSTLAIVAFVLAFVVPPGAIACGTVALRRIRTTGEQGAALALAGVVIGGALTGLVVLLVLLWVVLLGAILLHGAAIVPHAFG